jgi:hypothetical protein
VSEVIIFEASSNRNFIGKFHLGSIYYLEPFFGYFDVWKFKDTTNMFIDYSKPMPDENATKTRYLVVSDTALLVGEPISQSSKVMVCRGWNTLYKLHKLRRERDKPNIFYFVWDNDSHKEWVLGINDPDSFIEKMTFRMEAIGVE